jgi:radical SAM-linked protein
LQLEWKRAVSGELTPDCRFGVCNDCGACDFKTIFPQVFEACHLSRNNAAPVASSDNLEKFAVTYSKTGDARFFGHLEMVSIFLRAIRRAKIPAKYSQGFHPLPKVSFQDPLPIGMESEEETFYISVEPGVKPGAFTQTLNALLPTGLVIHDCKAAPSAKEKRKQAPLVPYEVILKDGCFVSGDLEKFVHAKDHVFQRQNRKGSVEEIDLKSLVDDIQLTGNDTLDLVLNNNSRQTVRPLEVIQHIFNLPMAQLRRARVKKRRIGF